ncbi:hypothetical protein SEEM162_06213 [Salmonella enterica subsp. enterica serovar Senftenberg str. 316235162]|nr:hypothetical protein SEEM162_06213 [Salmonella enterica subsp. enterica serovar Senftenberg str. 316235162]
MEAVVRFGVEAEEERLVFEGFLRFFAGLTDLFRCAFLFICRFRDMRNSRRRFGLPGSMGHWRKGESSKK